MMVVLIIIRRKREIITETKDIASIQGAAIDKKKESLVEMKSFSI